MQVRPVFDINPQINQTDYYWFKEGFNKEELEWLNNLEQLYEYEIASIVGSTTPNTEVRSSKIKWMNYNENSQWVYEKLSKFAIEANDTIWGFNLTSIVDSIQLTEYPENAGHYDWHVDIGSSISHRKISIVVQLSEPDSYEGGDLQIWAGGEFKTIPKMKGCVVLFPSFLLHRVTPVTKGIRKSLVLWLGGDSFK